MTKLKRSLSAPVLALYGLGNILGAGIYVLVGKVAGEAGINAPLAFLIAMIVAALTVFSYTELSSRFPQSAGSALYTFRAFKNKWLSLFVGFAMVLAGITSAAALSQGFAGYLGTIVPVPPLLASVGILILLTIVALIGISESARLAVAFTVIEVLGLLALIVFGAPQLSAGSVAEVAALDPAIGLTGLMSGAFLAFYAFIGFEDMVNVAEEAKDSHRSMPLAILISLIAAAVLYALVVLVSVVSVAPAELAKSSAPLSLVLERISTIDPIYISLIGMAAAFNGIIVQLIMGSRMLYGLANQGWISARFAKVHQIRQTPTLATLVASSLMIAGTILLPLVSLAQATSYLMLLIFALVSASLIVIKLRDGTPKNIVRVPLILPVLGVLSAVGVIVYELLAASSVL